MARAFSSDLRQLAVSKGGSSLEVAEVLQVSSSFVRKVRLRFGAEGTVEARPHGGGRERKITAESEQRVREILREREDITLEDLAQELSECCGISVSKSCMSKTLKRMGISRKKKRFTPARETHGACSSLATHIEHWGLRRRRGPRVP